MPTNETNLGRLGSVRMRGIGLGVSLVTSCVLSACSLAPAYVIPPTKIPAAYKAIGLWTPAAAEDDQPHGAWWLVFDDPVLDDLEARIPAGNPTLAAAVASFDLAQDYASEASASLFPWVSFSGSTSANRQSDKRPLRGSNQPNQYGDNQLGLETAYELDFWGRVRNAVAAGKAEAQASAADLETAKLSLEAELADTYFSLRSLDAQSRLLANTVTAYQRALDLVQARHDGGIASGLDVDRARTQLSVAKAQISDVAAARDLYEHAVAALVGEPAPSFTLASARWAAAIPRIPVGVPATLLQRRPDIASAERKVFAANASIGVARAAFFPRITLFGGAGFQNTSSGDLLVLPSSVWSVGPSVSLPIFEGGFLNAQLAAARAKFDEAGANYRGTVLAAFQQVQDNLSLANRLASEALDQQQAVEDAEATEALSFERYREGAVNYLDVVTAQTAAFEAERTSIALRTRREHAAVDLIRSIGGGWTADMQDTNSRESTAPSPVGGATAVDSNG